MTAPVDRELAAELVVLERFDHLREYAGHDYGSGQRGAELVRRRRELDVDHVDELDELELTPAELLDAFDRVGRPRLARAAAEGYRSHTPPTRRTLSTWQQLERQLRNAGSRVGFGATP